MFVLIFEKQQELQPEEVEFIFLVNDNDTTSVESENDSGLSGDQKKRTKQSVGRSDRRKQERRVHVLYALRSLLQVQVLLECENDTRTYFSDAFAYAIRRSKKPSPTPVHIVSWLGLAVSRRPQSCSTPRSHQRL